MSKAISNKLKAVFPTLISLQQTAYVKTRFTGENCRLISDNWNQGFLVTVDIEKAFYSLDHNFLNPVLRNFGLGRNFMTWTEMLLKDQLSCGINGGTTTQYFNVKRGTCQDDPIFAYLFILTLEILFLYIKRHPKIKGRDIFEH